MVACTDLAVVVGVFQPTQTHNTHGLIGTRRRWPYGTRREMTTVVPRGARTVEEVVN
jgi:hypothetical protein